MHIKNILVGLLFLLDETSFDLINVCIPLFFSERETETLNKARQLVFTNDLAPGHLGYVSG